MSKTSRWFQLRNLRCHSNAWEKLGMERDPSHSHNYQERKYPDRFISNLSRCAHSSREVFCKADPRVCSCVYVCVSLVCMCDGCAWIYIMLINFFKDWKYVLPFSLLRRPLDPWAADHSCAAMRWFAPWRWWRGSLESIWSFRRDGNRANP